jgi:hypothetical protein
MISINQINQIIGKKNKKDFEKFLKGKTYCHPNLIFRREVELYLSMKYGVCVKKDNCDICKVWEKYYEILKENGYKV